MYLQHLFRSFQPAHNTIGFGAADFVLLSLAILLSGLVCLRAAAGPLLERVANRPRLAMAVLSASAIVSRLLLLAVAPAPQGSGADDFSYLLLGDTLWHGRLANPTHPLHRFFEANFVLQQPTYSSIYPLGQGLVLALGEVLTGSFWAGVLVSDAALCALLYWTLSAFVSRKLALTGGFLAVLLFGPLSSWTNSYWGGALSGCAGCLVFGSLPRLRGEPRYAFLLGLGLALEWLARPFEFLLLAACVLLYWVMRLGPWPNKRTLLRAGVLVVIAFGLSALQNREVTGKWTTLPYMLSQYQYGVPTTFTFQANPEPDHALTPEQELNYRAQAAIHGDEPETLGRYSMRLAQRIRFLRFFWPAPLYLASLFFFPALRERKWAYAGLAILIFALGTNFYPYFFPHYAAAITCLLLLVALEGLRRLRQLRRDVAQAVLLVCGAQFLFWYLINAFGGDALAGVTRYESWDFLNRGDPEGRLAVAENLKEMPGKQLVFVRYAPGHRFHEWIHNAADIDDARVLWAADLGASEDAQLERYFSRRTSWLLEPDAMPPRLTKLNLTMNGADAR